MNELSSIPAKPFVVRLAAIALLTGGYFLFDYIYQNQIFPAYNYYGLGYTALNPTEIAILLFFYYLPTVFLPIELRRPSDIGVWLLFLFAYSPAILMGFHSLRQDVFQVLGLYATTLAGLATVWISRFHPVSFRLESILLRTSRLRFLLFFAGLLTCIYVFHLARFELSLGISDAYERRTVAREGGNILAGYLIAQARALIYIFGVFVFVQKRNILALALVVGLALAGFSYDGTKISLLTPIVLIGAGVFFRAKREMIWILIVPTFALLIAFVEYQLLDSHIVSERLIRRAFAIPGYISAAYFEFFSDNPFAMLTDSVGRYLADPIYDSKVAYLIGQHYYADPELNANTNIWLGGYAHFGIAGVLLVSVISGVILGGVDRLCGKRFFTLGCIACIYLGLKWSEQLLHTSLLSGGVLTLLTALFLVVHSAELQSKWGQSTPRSRYTSNNLDNAR